MDTASDTIIFDNANFMPKLTQNFKKDKYKYLHEFLFATQNTQDNIFTNHIFIGTIQIHIRRVRRACRVRGVMVPGVRAIAKTETEIAEGPGVQAQ